MSGLRERKRQRTHDTISEIAISLFLARGFDQVSVAEIAAAADVSKPTLFRYFPTKEDLVLHRIADHQGEAARTVQGVAGTHPLDALHQHFVAGLERRDPTTGLNDHPQVLAFHRMVFETPALQARVTRYLAADEEALAAALEEEMPPLSAALAAAQILAVQRVLARWNWKQLNGGRSADSVYPEALAAADAAFALLRDGLLAAG
jgi:AcrR family transcriptional regulator